MNLRDAKFKDHWRHVYERRYPTRLAQISFRQLSCFSNDTVIFGAGISAIVGGNGVGKSTLAAAIAEILSGPTDVAIGHRDRLKGSFTTGTAFVLNHEVNLGMQEGDQGSRIATGGIFDGDFRWLDPSELANSCTSKIDQDSGFEDLLDAITPVELDADELSIASYIVGKEYTSVRIYDISEYVGFERFPYFIVSGAGVEYGSETMGRGELSMLLSYWAVRDLEKNSILVLEEPETHVSPRSQNCLMNILAKFSDDKGIWIILTTHSPTIIRRIPREHVKLIVRENGPSHLAPEATNVDIIGLLGGGVAFRGAFLVEDAASKAFMLGILGELAPDLMQQFEVVIAGGESEIINALQTMPLMKTGLQLFGVFDGDMRPKLTGDEIKKLELVWPVVPLPSEVPPDALLREMLHSSELRSSIISKLLKSEIELTYALDIAAGLDDHDFMRTLGNALHLDVSFVRRSLVHIWLRDQSNCDSAKLLIDTLRARINSSLLFVEG